MKLQGNLESCQRNCNGEGECKYDITETGNAEINQKVRFENRK